MLVNVPMLVVPLIIFNIVGFGLIGGAGTDPWASEVMSVTMISGELWTMSLGDLMITLSLFFLFFEIIKATRIGASSIVDHLLSTFVFIAYLIEFLTVGYAAHAVFFILLTIALVDVVAGFSISIRSATRDVSFNG
ncbi:MAG: hypothetical protein GY761_15990 [Hyphomicrobiales bacterium]|nr:hypothetical protein [Hyphomicrobiales bacterium]